MKCDICGKEVEEGLDDSICSQCWVDVRYSGAVDKEEMFIFMLLFLLVLFLLLIGLWDKFF